MNKIIHSALCAYRNEQGALAARYIERAAFVGASDAQRATSLDKAIRALEECHAAHDELNTGHHNPATNLDKAVVAQMRAALGNAAEVVYAEAERRLYV